MLSMDERDQEKLQKKKQKKNRKKEKADLATEDQARYVI